MALTEFQRTLCSLIARHRLDSGESYVAGGVALLRGARGAGALGFHEGRIRGALPQLRGD